MWLRRHAAASLSAYLHGELSLDGAAWVSRHLEHCTRCREKFDVIRRGAQFAAQLPLELAPASLDAAVRRVPPARSAVTTSAAVWPWGARTAALVVATALLTIVALAYWRRPTPIDLSSYLDQVQTGESTTAAIGRGPAAFREVAPAEAFHVAGIDPALESPLAGYALRSTRIGAAGRWRVLQLVYARGSDVFAVFIAPSHVEFALGDRETQPVRLGDLPCRRVDCPRTTTMLFGERPFHGMLVSRVRDDRTTGDIVRHFIGLHGATGA